MINNPVVLPIRTRREAGVPDSIRLIRRVLVKHAAGVVLAPILHVHRVVAHELELTKTVVAVVGVAGGVDNEGLAGAGVGELLGAFIGGELVVEGAAVGRFFPGVGGDAKDLTVGEVGCDGVGVGHWWKGGWLVRC